MDMIGVPFHMACQHYIIVFGEIFCAGNLLCDNCLDLVCILKKNLVMAWGQILRPFGLF